MIIFTISERAIEAAVSHVQWVLEGFKLAQATDKHNQVYPPLRVPRDYRPVHVFLAQEAQSASITRPEKSQMTASSRAAMLGEIGIDHYLHDYPFHSLLPSC